MISLDYDISRRLCTLVMQSLYITMWFTIGVVQTLAFKKLTEHHTIECVLIKSQISLTSLSLSMTFHFSTQEGAYRFGHKCHCLLARDKNSATSKKNRTNVD